MRDTAEGSRREVLTREAVRLLEQEGPAGMTVRRITAKVGASRQVLYSDFGSMGGLVAAVVDHGFGLLRESLDAQTLTGDALADIWTATQTLRVFAIGHRHLYSVMYAAEEMAGYQRRGEELEQGLETLQYLHRLCVDAVKAGIFTVDHPRAATRHLWVAAHGHLMLENAGYMNLDADHEAAYAQTISTAMSGLGASAAAVAAAVPSRLHAHCLTPCVSS